MSIQSVLLYVTSFTYESAYLYNISYHFIVLKTSSIGSSMRTRFSQIKFCFLYNGIPLTVNFKHVALSMIYLLMK